MDQSSILNDGKDDYILKLPKWLRD